MADVQRPAGTPMADGAGRGRTVRRAGRRWAAALLVGSALTVGAAPAPADAPSSELIDLGVLQALLTPSAAQAQPAAAQPPSPHLVNHSDEPAGVIAPGASGQARVGLRNTGDADAVNSGRMYMELWAPAGSRFTDVTLTPVDGALGGWTCRGDQGVEGQPYESTILKCGSDAQGVVVPAGGTAFWQVNMKVSGDAPADTVLQNAAEAGYGATLYHSKDGRGSWSTMSLEIRTSQG